MVFGTPRYMSPEQATAENIDGRSDIYALGCMAYEMLCGRPPFEADTPIALLFKHVHDRPAPFAERRPDLVIPPEIEQITQRLLEKRPQDRPGSMKTLLDALDTAVSRLPRGFDVVVYRDAAETTGLLERLEQATSAPATVLEPELVRTQRRSPSELLQGPQVAQGLGTRKKHTRGTLILLLAGLSLLAASAVAGYQAYESWTAVEEMPAGLLPIFNEGLGLSLGAKLPDNEEIHLTIRSTPPGATARIGERRLGTTPLTWHTLKDLSESAVVVLELSGYQPYATDLRLEGSQIIDVEMESKDDKAPGTTRLRPRPKKAVAPSTTTSPAPKQKVTVKKKPVDFAPTKVRDTKKNPYQ
jgi:Protein kinase domain/PEGA domain